MLLVLKGLKDYLLDHLILIYILNPINTRVLVDSVTLG